MKTDKSDVGRRHGKAWHQGQTGEDAQNPFHGRIGFGLTGEQQLRLAARLQPAVHGCLYIPVRRSGCCLDTPRSDGVRTRLPTSRAGTLQTVRPDAPACPVTSSSSSRACGGPNPASSRRRKPQAASEPIASQGRSGRFVPERHRRARRRRRAHSTKQIPEPSMPEPLLQQFSPLADLTPNRVESPGRIPVFASLGRPRTSRRNRPPPDQPLQRFPLPDPRARRHKGTGNVEHSPRQTGRVPPRNVAGCQRPTCARKPAAAHKELASKRLSPLHWAANSEVPPP